MGAANFKRIVHTQGHEMTFHDSETDRSIPIIAHMWSPVTRSGGAEPVLGGNYQYVRFIEVCHDDFDAQGLGDAPGRADQVYTDGTWHSLEMAEYLYWRGVLVGYRFRVRG